MPTVTDPVFDLDGFLANLTPVPSDTRLVTFTVEAVTADLARCRLLDGTEATLAASEWRLGRPWRPGLRMVGVRLDGSDRPALSVTRPEQIEMMLAGVVPEVRDGVVQVKGVVRVAGLRAKVAVASTVATVDPVAACVGRKANRIRALVDALDGERVDVIPWSADPVTLLTAALAPAQVDRVEVRGRRADVYVPAHRMAATVGGGGLNSQLAGRLAGFVVQVVAA